MPLDSIILHFVRKHHTQPSTALAALHIARVRHAQPACANAMSCIVPCPAPQDCFYASVFEHQDPSLKSLPLAVQQKQIIVTCNYEARRRGLRKLQLIHEAKKVCPDVVIVLGEDLTRFRDASKHLYSFLRSFSWNSRCERLGFDEVDSPSKVHFPPPSHPMRIRRIRWTLHVKSLTAEADQVFLDVTDIIDYNVSILNYHHLTNAFFCLAKDDPTVGFPYNAARLTGHVYCKTATENLETTSLDPLHLRLALGSHLAHYIRTKLELEKGYTATAGVSTNKLLAKLVGSTHKPNAQTTLLPPYVTADDETTDNVTSFIDDHEVGQIPGIGFKIAQKLRAYALQRPAEIHVGLVYGETKEKVLVHDIRTCPGIGPETLERVLGGPGVPKGIGTKVWGLLNGCDGAEVGQAREVPRQISIEDSYIRLERIEEVTKELRMLATRLLERMHTDLLGEDNDVNMLDKVALAYPESTKHWLAHPKTIRLSTRPRPPQNADGSRNRSFARISKSAQMPTFVFSLTDGIDVIANRLLNETLLPLFRKLHPEKSGWNLSLINVAVTNMVDAASETGGIGRDIGKMFKRQDAVLKQWRVEEPATMQARKDAPERVGSEDAPRPSQEDERCVVDTWESEDEDMIDGDSFRCDECGALMPTFAMGAHYRWHASM
ncbi:hypothetical protein GMOD_00005777 [Pyrenophora seminiperda CCB06]|uniref:UmuC domain-containing protein n=1 Tax=Pyrenophora seminiperda CCB06 TaxID=1302712 RepID=A0A3M7M9W0_9PLEO|nr:hypothetical protein GMOD_00005777 [Pyrenophora seminiperda CCB06]